MERFLAQHAVRRAEVSRRANERYLEALAVVSMPQPVAQTFDPVSARYVTLPQPNLRTALRNTSRQAWISGDGSLGFASYSMLM